ncbi:MAG: hypothetical protein RLT30_11255, partial [Gammaproteobacteria bacterium]
IAFSKLTAGFHPVLFLKLVSSTTRFDINLFLVKDVDLSTRQLVEALANGFNMKPRLFSAPESLLEFAAALTGNTDRLNKLISNLVVDDTSFRNKTGWKPAVNFEKAIELTTDWYKTDCLK